MKKLLPFAMAMALAAPAFGQEAVSDPVGYISLGNVSADGGDVPALAAGSEIVFSLPLLQPIEATVTVGSFSNGVISVDEILTAGDFDAPQAGAPSMIHVQSGDAEGAFGLIQANDEGSITVMGQTASILDGLAEGDVVAIREAVTISSVIPADSVPTGVQVNLFDPIEGINTSSTTTLQAAGANWVNVTAGGLGNDVVLFPNEAYVMVNPTATDIDDLVITGAVPLSDSFIPLATSTAGAQDTRFAFVSPVSQPISEAGLPAQTGDQVLVFNNAASGINKSAATTLQFANGNWINITAGGLANDFPLEGGQGFVFRRAAAGDGDDINADGQPTYVSGL